MRLPRIFLVMKKRRYAFFGESFCFFIVFGVVLLIAGSDGAFGSAGVYLPALDDTFAANRLPHHLRASQVVSGLTLIGAVSLLDDTLYDAVHEARSPARAAFFNKTTHLGDGLTALAVVVAMWPFDPETAELITKASLRTSVATLGLKLLISRHRPSQDPTECRPYRIDMTCVSMPSGHTSTAFSVARVLAHQYPPYKGLFYAIAALAGWSRVETSNHWPSDVVAGALLGMWVAESALPGATD